MELYNIRQHLAPFQQVFSASQDYVPKGKHRGLPYCLVNLPAISIRLMNDCLIPETSSIIIEPSRMIHHEHKWPQKVWKLGTLRFHAILIIVPFWNLGKLSYVSDLNCWAKIGDDSPYEHLLPSGAIKHGWLENPLGMEVFVGKSLISTVHFPACHLWLPDGIIVDEYYICIYIIRLWIVNIYIYTHYVYMYYVYIYIYIMMHNIYIYIYKDATGKFSVPLCRSLVTN